MNPCGVPGCQHWAPGDAVYCATHEDVEKRRRRLRAKVERETIARVVAWLRPTDHDVGNPWQDMAADIADAIERGDWRSDAG